MNGSVLHRARAHLKVPVWSSLFLLVFLSRFFRERLSHKRGKAYATMAMAMTMLKVIMGNGAWFLRLLDWTSRCFSVVEINTANKRFVVFCFFGRVSVEKGCRTNGEKLTQQWQRQWQCRKLVWVMAHGFYGCLIEPQGVPVLWKETPQTRVFRKLYHWKMVS